MPKVSSGSKRSSLRTSISNFVLRSDSLARLLWRLKGFDQVHLKGNRASRFTSIYDTGVWIDHDRESSSGPGSTIKGTNKIREALPAFLAKVQATSLLDVGCGDFNWMQQVDLPCDYIGVDIVPSVIVNLQETFGSPRRQFLVADACDDALPKADVVLCREVLFHLSFDDMKRLLRNVRNTKARFLLATTAPAVEINRNIPTGDFTERNLAIAPLRLGEPIDFLPDNDWGEGRVLGVWRL